MVDQSKVTAGDSVYRAEETDFLGNPGIKCRRLVVIRNVEEHPGFMVAEPIKIRVEMAGGPASVDWDSLFATPEEATIDVIARVATKGRAFAALADLAERKLVETKQCGEISVTVENHKAVIGETKDD